MSLHGFLLFENWERVFGGVSNSDLYPPLMLLLKPVAMAGEKEHGLLAVLSRFRDGDLSA